MTIQTFKQRPQVFEVNVICRVTPLYMYHSLYVDIHVPLKPNAPHADQQQVVVTFYQPNSQRLIYIYIFPLIPRETRKGRSDFQLTKQERQTRREPATALSVGRLMQ